MTKRHVAAMVAGAALCASVPTWVLAAEDATRTETIVNPRYRPAMERYERLLKAYEKDQAAYEADPGTWTAEIPRKPERPDVQPTITRAVARASAAR